MASPSGLLVGWLNDGFRFTGRVQGYWGRDGGRRFVRVLVSAIRDPGGRLLKPGVGALGSGSGFGAAMGLGSVLVVSVRALWVRGVGGRRWVPLF